MLDSQFTMSSHITSLCQSGYYQLRQLSGIIQSLTPDATKTLVHAFISSRLDYCNSLLFGVADQQLKLITVSTECRCPSGDWYTTLRSYHSGVEGPPLAASPAAHTVQNGDVGAQVPK